MKFYREEKKNVSLFSKFKEGEILIPIKVSPYRPRAFDRSVKKNMPGKLFFVFCFRINNSSYVSYISNLYQGASQYR